jgi:NAD(P)-dependent dehydrogenase (short-subunit alcohol dehydrogenase family)
MTSSSQVAVITGGAGGFGKACSERLSDAGWLACIVDVDADGVAAVREATPSVAAYVADVADESQVDSVFTEIVERYGRVDALVNNAGISPRSCPLHETPLEQWRHTLDVNLTSMFLCTRAVLRPMLAQGRGSIVNIASILGMVGFEPELIRQSPYAAAKAGVVGLTLQTAAEYGRDGIRCNAVAPGWHLDTRLAERSGNLAASETSRRLDDAISHRTALGRTGTSDELARTVSFLAGDDSSYITGAVIPHDGGWLAM